MNTDWKSYPWLRISLVLYAIACCCPALELTTTTREHLTPVTHDNMWGVQLLMRGFMGIFFGIVAWFANPLWVVALLLVYLKWVKTALAVSAASLVIAFTSFLAIGKDLAVWESDIYHQHPSALLPGFYLWMASLAVVPLACWLRITSMRNLSITLLLCAALHTPATAQNANAVQATRPTAAQVIERIQKNAGVAWRSQTVDTFKAGDPDTPVTGIATTMMATYDVLRRAAAAGDNLIITHEPTFYGHKDETAALATENDAVLAAKQAFIEEHHLVVWRFHDHWHARRPDGIQTGMIRALGWEKFKNANDDRLFVIPETTLDSLASNIKERLGIRTLRVVGDPALRVTKLAVNLGYPGFPGERHMLQRDDIEALVMGEGLEWETIEYGADAAAEGKHKALVILGHIPSEQAGMEDCAVWLRGFVTEVKVEFIATAEPFWPAK